MAIFFTVVLMFSILGMASLLGVKQWELQTNNLVWVRVRPKVGKFFRTISFWVEQVLPALVRIWTRRLWHTVRVWVHRTVARGVLATEQWLERVLHILRHTTDARAGAGTASAFLREVAEHKKKLSRRKHTNPPV